MTRLDAAKDFQKAMKGRVFVNRVGAKYWLYDDGDTRRWTPIEKAEARLRASGMPEEWER